MKDLETFQRKLNSDYNALSQCKPNSKVEDFLNIGSHSENPMVTCSRNPNPKASILYKFLEEQSSDNFEVTSHSRSIDTSKRFLEDSPKLSHSNYTETMRKVVNVGEDEKYSFWENGDWLNKPEKYGAMDNFIASEEIYERDGVEIGKI